MAHEMGGLGATPQCLGVHDSQHFDGVRLDASLPPGLCLHFVVHWEHRTSPLATRNLEDCSIEVVCV